MTDETLRDMYHRANQYRKPAFTERPYLGSPGAPAQDEHNVSKLWGHMNAGFLIGYEYSRWWHESRALRTAAVLGDWSWLNKVMVTGPNAEKFLDYASVQRVAGREAGQVLFTPMTNEDGKVAIEGLTFKLADDRFLFSQSGAQMWLRHLRERTGIEVELEDVTPDYTCFALQGPKSTDILEAVTGQDFRDMKFSRYRTVEILGEQVMIDRQGVTGEVGYEFLMPTAGGNAPDLWRRIRDVGRDFGLRELGLKAQLIGHTETGIASAVRDYLPARMPADKLMKFAGLWLPEDELAALDHDLTEHWCTPAELGWANIVDLDGGDFLGRDALAAEAERGGPARRFVGLSWNGDDMAELYANLFRDGPSAPPPDLPTGQYRMQFLRVEKDGRHVGWASGTAYSPTLSRMISMARVDKDAAEPGTEIVVRWGGFSTEPAMGIRAEVTALPFIKQNRRKNLSPQ